MLINDVNYCKYTIYMLLILHDQLSARLLYEATKAFWNYKYKLLKNVKNSNKQLIENYNLWERERERDTKSNFCEHFFIDFENKIINIQKWMIKENENNRKCNYKTNIAIKYNVLEILLNNTSTYWLRNTESFIYLMQNRKVSSYRKINYSANLDTSLSSCSGRVTKQDKGKNIAISDREDGLTYLQALIFCSRETRRVATASQPTSSV